MAKDTDKEEPKKAKKAKKDKNAVEELTLIHISEPTRRYAIA